MLREIDLDTIIKKNLTSYIFRLTVIKQVYKLLLF